MKSVACLTRSISPLSVLQRKCWWDGVDIVVPHTSTSASTAEQDGSAAMADEMASEAEEADVNAPTAGMTAHEVELLRSKRGRSCRVWARRVWTLELSLVSMPG